MTMVPADPAGALRLLYVGDGPTGRLPVPGPAETAWDVDRAATATECVGAAGRGDYDLLLIGPEVAERESDAILAWCRENRPDLPVMMVEGTEVAATAEAHAGAVRAGRATPAPGGASLAEPAARALLESTSDLIGSLTADGWIDAVNDRVRAFLGRSPAEVVGTRFVDWVDPSEQAALRECLASVGEGRRARCDVRLVGDRGARVGSATFLARPGGGTPGVLFFVADVTDDRAAQRDLLAAHQDLRRDRERLRRLAIVDGLTGLYNHRYGKEVLRNLVDQSRRYGHPLSLVMIDLDHFKQVNDAHGHLAGDQVLQAVARMIRESVRSSDVAVRYGGEEIALLLPNTGPADAFRLAERLRARCRRLEFRFGDQDVRVAFSAGTATLSATGPADATALIRKADDNLYCAKLAGRNRVVGDGCVEGDDGAACVTCDAGRRRVLDRFQALAHRFSLGQLGAVQSLVHSLEMKSPYAASHGLDVMRLAGAIARAVGFDADAADRIACAGYLHDVGLIAVPEVTLAKSGALDEAEWRLIRRHPDWGRHLLRNVPMLAEERAWIAGHHERLDGSGYPHGLKGRKLSLPCQVLALADVVCAMRADRPYRAALPVAAVLAEVEARAGRGFDRDLVAVLPGLLASPPPGENPSLS